MINSAGQSELDQPAVLRHLETGDPVGANANQAHPSHDLLTVVEGLEPQQAVILRQPFPRWEPGSSAPPPAQ